MNERELGLSVELLKSIQLERLKEQKSKLEEEIKADFRRELPPLYTIEVTRTQYYGYLGKEESVVLTEVFDVEKFFRFIQIMKLIDDPEYVKALSKLPEVSDAAKVFIEKQMSFYKLVQEYSCELIRTALIRTNGNQTQAARLLQMNRTTLVEMIKKYGIKESTEPFTIINNAANEA